MRQGLKSAMIHHDLFPLFCLSAKKNMGSGRIMGFIDNICPGPAEVPPPLTVAGDPVPCDPAGPPCIFVYKILSEPHIGEMSFFKVYSGTIKSGMELVNETSGVTLSGAPKLRAIPPAMRQLFATVSNWRGSGLNTITMDCTFLCAHRLPASWTLITSRCFPHMPSHE